MKDTVHNDDLNHPSDEFIEGLYNVGFGCLPISVLCEFHVWITDRFGYTPLPSDDKWEEVLNLAEEIFVGDE